MEKQAASKKNHYSYSHLNLTRLAPHKSTKNPIRQPTSPKLVAVQSQSHHYLWFKDTLYNRKG
jgi:hypothetical protein